MISKKLLLYQLFTDQMVEKHSFQLNKFKQLFGFK
jgi:hypothetical protein